MFKLIPAALVFLLAATSLPAQELSTGIKLHRQPMMPSSTTGQAASFG